MHPAGRTQPVPGGAVRGFCQLGVAHCPSAGGVDPAAYRREVDRVVAGNRRCASTSTSRIATDEGIQTELDIYNPVIPEPGQLSSTLFIELTSDDELRDWLPRLVGIERSVVVRFGGQEVRSRPDRDHEAQLTREEITASVHYIQFDFSEANLAAWGAAGPIEVAVDHSEYRFSTTLSAESVTELTSDLLA